MEGIKTFLIRNSTENLFFFSRRNLDKYNCPICHRNFAFAVNLKKHFWFEHSTTGGNFRIKASQAIPISVPLPTKKEKLDEKLEDMKCSVCGKICLNWKNLEVHMLAHTNQNPFKCEVCGKGFRVSKRKHSAIV